MAQSPNEMKIIKVTPKAHRAMIIAKFREGMNMSRWASEAILTALKKDYPEVWKELEAEYEEIDK